MPSIRRKGFKPLTSSLLPKPGVRNNEPFYHTSLWRATRRVILDAEPLCRYCKHEGLITIATICDHIIRIEDGGSKTDEDNLQPLCVRHHAIKSQAEGRGTLDPITQQLYG